MAPGLSIREQILDTLAAELRAIRAGATYAHDVKRVVRAWPNETQEEGAQPAIFVFGPLEVKSALGEDGASVDEVVNELELNVIFLLKGLPAQRETLGASLAADVETCLTTPQSRMIAGSVVDVLPTKLRLYVEDIYGDQAGGHAQYLVRYTTRLGDPRAAS